MQIDIANLPNNFLVGLGITVSKSGQKHIGFIYKDSINQLKICHLCWHRVLKNEPFSNHDYLINSIIIDEFNLKFLASIIENIADINAATIPYGLRMPLQPFDNDYRYIGNVNGEGLTCATFILSVFKSNGYQILDEGSWVNAPEDTSWQLSIVKLLKCHFGMKEPKHISEMERLVGNATRFKPEQVYSCGVVEPKHWPVNYSDSQVMAQSVLELLKNYNKL